MGEDAPYWKQAYGIARPWRSTPGVKWGCLVSLWAALALVTAVLVVAFVMTLR